MERPKITPQRSQFIIFSGLKNIKKGYVEMTKKNLPRHI